MVVLREEEEAEEDDKFKSSFLDLCGPTSASSVLISSICEAFRLHLIFS